MTKRPESTFGSIISPDQTGFFANRFIGDNRRLVYDTLKGDYYYYWNLLKLSIL